MWRFPSCSLATTHSPAIRYSKTLLDVARRRLSQSGRCTERPMSWSSAIAAATRASAPGRRGCSRTRSAIESWARRARRAARRARRHAGSAGPVAAAPLPAAPHQVPADRAPPSCREAAGAAVAQQAGPPTGQCGAARRAKGPGRAGCVGPAAEQCRSDGPARPQERVDGKVGGCPGHQARLDLRAGRPVSGVSAGRSSAYSSCAS